MQEYIKAKVLDMGRLSPQVLHSIIEKIDRNNSYVLAVADEDFRAYFCSIKACQHDLFDIASLSKSFTATALAIAMTEHNLYLDTPLQTVIPSFAEGISFRDLLSYKVLAQRNVYEAWIKSLTEGVDNPLEEFIKLDFERFEGFWSRYSNVPPIIMSHIVRQLSGMSFEEYVKSRIFEPLGLRHTGFDAKRIIESSQTKFPQMKLIRTETASEKRKKLLGKAEYEFGDVHDELSLLLREKYGLQVGVAGIFSSAYDISKFSSQLLRLVLGLSTPLSIRKDLIEELAGENYTKAESVPFKHVYRMGFAKPRLNDYNFGDHVSAQSFGILGYTGCMFVVDPKKRLSLTFLSNIVYPRRYDSMADDIADARRALCDITFKQ